MDQPVLGPTGTLIMLVVKALVDRPDEVYVTELRGIASTTLEVIVAPSDFGKLIGKQGRTANALRELLVNIGAKQDRRFVLEAIDPQALRRAG